MIPKEIIDKNSNYWYSYNSDLGDGFIKGVEFAEEYLKDLTIEFAEWLLQKHLMFCEGVEGMHYRDSTIGGNKYTSKELFKIFIKEKYDNRTK